MLGLEYPTRSAIAATLRSVSTSSSEARALVAVVAEDRVAVELLEPVAEPLGIHPQGTGEGFTDVLLVQVLHQRRRHRSDALDLVLRERQLSGSRRTSSRETIRARISMAFAS
ncbi:hypothetical protein ACFU98_38195 [Streptomyces sp. NPDC057575]|uniref:hypothetical protein n=1 Tax=unclassified Streptomyces TaxID=2593676 RepID=UPI0036A38E39